ncbi:hypothetical protein EDB86DRAFT_2874110 [Lactarius hatsudake]|nr:hypothetical protein EDB86DRAFT_2874110 [Lactarius hatsudake]
MLASACSWAVCPLFPQIARGVHPLLFSWTALHANEGAWRKWGPGFARAPQFTYPLCMQPGGDAASMSAQALCMPPFRVIPPRDTTFPAARVLTNFVREKGSPCQFPHDPPFVHSICMETGAGPQKGGWGASARIRFAKRGLRGHSFPSLRASSRAPLRENVISCQFWGLGTQPPSACCCCA